MRNIITRILSLSSNRARNTIPPTPKVSEQFQEDEQGSIESLPLPRSPTDTESSLPSPTQVFHTPPTSRPSTGHHPISTPKSSGYYSLYPVSEMQTPPLSYSPHSKLYASQLQLAVDSIATALTERGRLADSHGLRELYKQSFKDPGSAELLDALLRNKASERQKIDFQRYVEDVNTLQGQEQLTSGVLGPTETRKRKAEITEDCEDCQEQNTESVHETPRLFKRSKNEDEPWLRALAKEVSAEVGRKAVQKRKQGPELQLSPQDQDLTELDIHGIIQDRSNYLSNMPVKRRRMTKMFHGANGPVYSRTLVL